MKRLSKSTPKINKIEPGMAKGAVWGVAGWLLGSFRARLGSFWLALGVQVGVQGHLRVIPGSAWVALGTSWVALGTSFGHPGDINGTKMEQN